MNLIIFDIDDTLTKSEFQHQLAYVNTMKEFGFKVINEEWKTYAHHTDSFILKENYLQNFDNTFDFTFIDGFEKRMTKILESLPAVSEIEGAKEAVAYFSRRNDYAICFATGSLLQPALLKLNQAEFVYHPALVTGSNQHFKREEILEQSIQKAKVHYNIRSFRNIISVGDGIWDLKTARNLGVYFLGIGMKNFDDFKKEEIKAHIKDWNGFDMDQIEKEFGLKHHNHQ